MILKSLIMKLFDAAYMQRWNDKLRPIELVELDKQAHKMFIAYFLGKFDENKKDFDWLEIIEGGLFELLQRIVITDIKPPIFYKIKADSEKYRRLNEFVFSQLKMYISPVGNEFCDRFRRYFTAPDNTLNRRILNAAHIYASQWEFEIIERLNPKEYDIENIKNDFLRKIEDYNDLTGMQQIKLESRYKNFIDLCGRLRFQARWAHLHRIPRTSVIGHSLFVALLSYLFSLEMGACPRRLYNNFFTGLFHDLPEVLTRDIISPVKRKIEGLSDLIKEYEKEQMEKEIYPLLPASLIKEVRMYTENEFATVVNLDGKIAEVTSEDINQKYNKDKYNPRDGRLVKAADDLAAFIEAKVANERGCTSDEFQTAMFTIKKNYEEASIGGIKFSEIYAEF